MGSSRWPQLSRLNHTFATASQVCPNCHEYSHKAPQNDRNNRLQSVCSKIPWPVVVVLEYLSLKTAVVPSTNVISIEISILIGRTTEKTTERWSRARALKTPRNNRDNCGENHGLNESRFAQHWPTDTRGGVGGGVKIRPPRHACVCKRANLRNYYVNPPRSGRRWFRRRLAHEVVFWVCVCDKKNLESRSRLSFAHIDDSKELRITRMRPKMSIPHRRSWKRKIVRHVFDLYK